MAKEEFKYGQCECCDNHTKVGKTVNGMLWWKKVTWLCFYCGFIKIYNPEYKKDLDN
jgi:RNase P subunit RPR2